MLVKCTVRGIQVQLIPCSTKTMYMKKTMIHDNFLLSGRLRQIIVKVRNVRRKMLTSLWDFRPRWHDVDRNLFRIDVYALDRYSTCIVKNKFKCKLFQNKTLKNIQIVAFSIWKQNFNLKKAIVSDRDSSFGQVNAWFASKGKYQQ